MPIQNPGQHQINTNILGGEQGWMAVKYMGASTIQFINLSLLPTLAVQTASTEQKSTSSIPAEVLNDLHLSFTFIKGRLYLCSLGAFEFEGIGESLV